MKKSIMLTCSIIVFLVISCGPGREKQGELVIHAEIMDSLAEAGPQIRFYYYEEKSEYPDAILEMYSPLDNQKFKPGKVPFEFNIKNYPFDAGLRGFQLKMILNGGDPVGYNSPMFQRELKEGTYRAVAYLVDEEGLSLKEFGNYVDRDFMVGETRAFPYQAEPYLAVNLPYNGQQLGIGEELMVDFLVLGGDLKQDKLSVILELNEARYEMDKMSPVRIADLPSGEYSLRLRLVKQDGKELDGPFSSMKRTIFIE